MTVVWKTSDVADVLARARGWPVAGIDTESTGPDLIEKDMLNVYESRMTGVSLAFDHESYYFPITHQFGPNLGEPARWMLRKFVAEYPGWLWAHNWKHDMQVFYQEWKVKPKHPKDSQIAAFLLGHSPLGLKYLALTMLGMNMASFQDTTQGRSFDALPPDEAAPYACDDAVATLRLGQLLYPQLQEYGLDQPFENLEMPLVDILRRMEARGMAIDYDKLRQLQQDLEGRIEELKEDWDFLAPGVLISSGQQVAQHVYEGDKPLWPDPGIRTKSGAMPTNKDARKVVMAALDEGSEGYQLAETLDEFKLLDKNLNTYTHGLIDIAEQYSDKSLHTSFNQTVARTGRLSSSGPNLQNIPVRTELGRRVKQAFVPRPGYVFLSADYSQIELRFLAHLTKQGRLVDAYSEGADIHQATADLVGCSRDQGKIVNFATVYGIGPNKLGRSLGVSKKEAKTFLDNYYKAYPEVGELKERVMRFAYKHGYVKTWAGRIRWIPEIVAAKARPERADSTAQKLSRWAGERKAFNTPIQGSAGDLVKKAMVDFQQEIDNKYPEGYVYLVNQVHDEITCEVKEDIVEEVSELLQQTMEQAAQLRVPLVAEPAWGYTWLDAK